MGHFVVVEYWERGQTHYQSQLEMLNPQRTLERGYAVILSQGQTKGKDQLHAVRNPGELNTVDAFQVRLAEGRVDVKFSDLVPK